jgi:hypothetical protein
MRTVFVLVVDLHALDVALLQPPGVVGDGISSRLLMKRGKIPPPDDVESAASGVDLVKNLIPVWHL